MNKDSSFFRVCDLVSKYCIYAAIFLLPIFFLPWTSDVLDFNKQTLLVVLIFISFFCWLMKVLFSGTLKLRIGFLHIAVGIFFAVYLLSLVFSLHKYGSFWGWPQITSDSFLTLICFVLLYFLITGIFSQKDIFVSLVLLSVSSLLAELIGILQLLGAFVIPANFARSVAFNTVGSVGSLGFFSAVLAPLAIILLIGSKKWWKVLFALNIAASLAVLFLVNYPIVWWAVAAGSAVVLVFGMAKRDLFDARWMALPTFCLAVSLFFILLNFQPGFIPQRANEIFLSQGESFKIALQALKANPILGSGPGTFAFDFSKYKDANMSAGILWTVVFNKSASKIIDSIATVGMLGFLALLLLVFTPIFYGLKFLFKQESVSGRKDIIFVLGFTSALAGLAVSYFLYSSSLTLDFIFFFLIAIMFVYVNEKVEEYELRPSSLLTLVITFIFTLLFIFELGLLIWDGQRYFAEVNYYNGILALQNNLMDEGIKKIESAANFNSSSDLYFRQLAQGYLSQLQQELSKTGVQATDEEKTKIQNLISNSINAGKIATDLSPNNSANWSVRGYVYQNLLGVIKDADTWAKNSYEQAISLSPNDPYLWAQKGNVFFSIALKTDSGQQDEKNKDLEQARDALKKAVELNPIYANALYSLGLVYDSLGQKDKAIEEFTKVQQLNPEEVAIPKILDNLNAGRPALQSPAPTPESPSEQNPEASVKNPPEKPETKK